MNKIQLDQISSFYHIDMYRVDYQSKIMSLRSKRFCKMDQYLPIEPPLVEKNRGRLKTKRMREGHEQIPKKPGIKLSRKGIHVTCSIFKQQGHNKATCLNVCYVDLLFP